MSTTSTDASPARHPFDPGRRSADTATINSAIALRLELLGVPAPTGVGDPRTDRLVSPILARQREMTRRLSGRLCAADRRIQAFLDSYLDGAAALKGAFIG